MTETSSGPAESSNLDEGPAEFRILAALWRWALPILLLTALVAGAVWFVTRSAVPIRTVQSELLVRVGFEYSPVPWSSVSETQQINFRADEVIGTEIQLITSEGVIQKALATAPHPEVGPAASADTYDPAQVLLVRQKLAVKRLEGSNVILLELHDADPAWSIAFSKALLESYLQDRNQLFSNASYDKLLDDDQAAADGALASLESETRQISQRMAEDTDYLSGSAAALAASPAQPELRALLARDIRGLQIYVSRMDRMSYLQDTLERLDRVLAYQTAPSTTSVTTGPGNLVSDDLLKAAVDRLAGDAARLNAIAAERDSLAKRLDTIRTAQQRKAMRDEASHNMTVMTPPRLLATPNGIDRIQQTVLAGLMALILSSLVFVYLEGIRHRSAWRG
jgi:hypothetical protein